jgi:hypothetical protein
MARLQAHGFRVDPPRGWESEIYQRPPEQLPGYATAARQETSMPIVHLANFPLPAERGDYGGGAVELMGRGGIFIAVLEHDPVDAGTPLFAGKQIPWPLGADDFDRQQMQRTIAGQSGCQRFFVAAGRAFCLYVALGSHTMRTVLVPEANAALATLAFD